MYERTDLFTRRDLEEGALMSFTRSDLKDLDRLYKDASGSGPEPGEIPEGKYQAKLKEVQFGASSGGRPQCKFVWKIVGGAEGAIGKEITTYDGLETSQNMGFFRRKLKRLRLGEPSSFEEVPEMLEGAVGAIAEIQVKFKDDFVNVYINKLVTAAAEEEEAPAKSERKSAKKKKKKAEPEEEPEEKEEEEEPAAEEEEEPAAEEEEEEEEEAEERSLPTQAELKEMPKTGLLKLLKEEFKVDPATAKKKKEFVLRGVACTLVAVMEDDKFNPTDRELHNSAKMLGLEPKEKRKATMREIIKKLGGD